MYAFPGLYMPRVGSRQASLNKLIWCTLLCYLLCSGDKIICHSHDLMCCKKSLASTPELTVTVTAEKVQIYPAVAVGAAKFEFKRN